jgi:hypothetical protein
VFENIVLRKIFGPKRDEVTGDWRRLHNEELYDLYTSRNIIRVIKLRRKVGGACRTYGGRGGGRPLGRPRRRWEANIKKDLQEVGEGMDWIDMAQDRDRWRALVYAVMNLLASEEGLSSMELA